MGWDGILSRDTNSNNNKDRIRSFGNQQKGGEIRKLTGIIVNQADTYYAFFAQTHHFADQTLRIEVAVAEAESGLFLNFFDDLLRAPVLDRETNGRYTLCGIGREVPEDSDIVSVSRKIRQQDRGQFALMRCDVRPRLGQVIRDDGDGLRELVVGACDTELVGQRLGGVEEVAEGEEVGLDVVPGVEHRDVRAVHLVP